jgi:hypothetical protein
MGVRRRDGWHSGGSGERGQFRDEVKLKKKTISPGLRPDSLQSLKGWTKAQTYPEARTVRELPFA